MKRIPFSRLSICLLATISSYVSFAQDPITLSYYLPKDVTYNPAIPTPESILGHEVGEWHVTHDKLVEYMYALDKASDRVSLEVTGHTHEGRPLLLLTITSPKNHQNIGSLLEQHQKLSTPGQSETLDIKTMPVVFYLGCSIHGNEASGANAGLIGAYHLAASQGAEIESYLTNTIILFDPSFNPDGLQRFSGWVNARKSRSVSADPNDAEHNEAWPGGRFNHYWFDLNRDWLVAQHPESQARIRMFQKWRPNVLTDHHEQGTDATFFFMPGVPTRVHPLTPAKNQELTKKMGEFHAKALDEIGSLYFTQEGYDDFYYGKGSTYPDAQGCVGILFEQASSRGHAQESINGVLRFPFTIRNHFVTMLSTLKAVNGLREELLSYQRDFYKGTAAEAAKDPVKGYVFGSSADKATSFHFVEMALRQDIDVYPLTSNTTVNGKTFEAGSAYVIPLNQRQYKLIQGMFYKQTKFTDSLFYDISSWTLPLAFHLDYEEVRSLPALGNKMESIPFPQGKILGNGTYAYLFETQGYYSPRAIYRLLDKEIRIKVSTEETHVNGKRLSLGSILVPAHDQKVDAAVLSELMKTIAEKDGIDVHAASTGLDYSGVSLGSRSFDLLNKPTIAMVVDVGASATDAGELWHLLDTRFEIPVTLLPIPVLNSRSIDKYTTLIFPEGVYSAIPENTKQKLKDWVQAGGTLIGFERAVSWFNSAGLGKFEMKKDEENGKEAEQPQPYANIDENRGAQATSGSIFMAEVDLTNPLLFGYRHARMPLFKSNNLFMEKSKGAYSNPITFGGSPLISGYISSKNYDKLKNTSCIGVSALGEGRVIGFTENQAFRAFWFGTNKLIMNAIFYGPGISREATR